MATRARAGFTRAFGRIVAPLWLAAWATATPVAAQEPPPEAAPAPDSAPPADEMELPDIEITATVSWKQLRFDVVGEPTVEFPGTPERKTVWETERIRLPRPVEPGVVYRDGEIRLTISSMFEALSRLYSAPEPPRP
jgi:hypothetical protein